MSESISGARATPGDGAPPNDTSRLDWIAVQMREMANFEALEYDGQYCVWSGEPHVIAHWAPTLREAIDRARAALDDDQGETTHG